MKRMFLMFYLLVLFNLGCEETTIYESDPRLFDDAFRGSIVGRVLQSESSALIIVSQVEPIDTATVNSDDGSFIFENLPIGNYDLTITSENYRTMLYRNVVVSGAGTTYLGDIELSTIPDLVSSHYPENNGEIVFNNRYSRLTISIYFTEPMDRESVEAAFSTIPPAEGRFSWNTYSNYPSNIYFECLGGGLYSDPDLGAEITTYSDVNSFTYSLTQKDSYVDTTYFISLSTEAKDTLGNHLRFPLEFTFSTIQSSSTLNGIQTIPYHGDVEVDLLSNEGISILFPRNMDKASVENAVTLEPSKGEVFLWTSSNSVNIYTGGVYLADTTYLVTIDSTAKDLDGISMGNPYSFSFSTEDLKLRKTRPRNAEVFVNLNEEINLYFNSYMILSSVQSSFTITPHVPGQLRYYNNSSKTHMEFNPSQYYLPNTKYTVKIAEGAKDLFGSEFKNDYEFSFVTRP